ncbi:hypothetical protein Dimus_017562 [Dionaea muscipula]
MLPLSLLKTAQGHPMLVELKNGETYNGHLVNCDTWMNIHLREVEIFFTTRIFEATQNMSGSFAGNTIKYLRVPDEVIDKVQEETKSGAEGLLGWVVEEVEGERMVLGGKQRALDVVWMMKIKTQALAEAVVVLRESQLAKVEAEDVVDKIPIHEG